MEKKNEYKLNELILGTRNLYQGHQKDLRLLKDFCIPTKNNIEDFSFYVYQGYPTKDSGLCCDYKKRQNTLQKGMSKVKELVIGKDLTENTGFFQKGEDGIYTIISPQKEFPVKITGPISFGRLTSEILESEFVKNIKLQKEEANINHIESVDGHSNVSFSQNNIREYHYKNQYPDYCLTYCGSTDTILFMAFDEKMSTENVGYALNVTFPASGLSKYHIDSITTSEILEKPIVLERTEPCKVVEYRIVEEENQVVFQRVKSK